MNAPAEDAQCVTLEPGGPLLLEGPIVVTLGDGTWVRSERPTVALCTCRRSRRYPWCDTSHRRRSRRPADGPERRDRKDRRGQDTDAGSHDAR